MTSPAHARLVGYLVDPGFHHQNEFLGTAVIDGKPNQHLLRICTPPHEFIDVGRNEDGDLVWISEHKGERHPIPELSATPLLPLSFDPPNNEDDLVEVAPTTPRALRSVTGMLSRRRVLVLSSAVSGVLLVFVGLGLTARPADSIAISPHNNGESIQASNQPIPGPADEPTEAALDFVVEGKVPGISVPEGLSRDSLSATVVSTSGEIVLVDVQADQPEGLTTFATLLLQKSGTAWRIREVFDPR